MHYILLIIDGSVDDSCSGDYSTGELAGAVVATFFITILVNAVVLVTVIAVVLKCKRNRYFQTFACTVLFASIHFTSP